MKNSDVVIKIDDVLEVVFVGSIAPLICSYELRWKTKGNFGLETKRTEKFTGQVFELFAHVSDMVKRHNEHCNKFGGTLI